MRFLKRWKCLSKNSDIEYSQNKVENDKKDLWIKRAKKGAKYLHAGFLAYCLLAVGTGGVVVTI